MKIAVLLARTFGRPAPLLPLAQTGIGDMLHALWLVAVLSLVYAATRHERLGPIFPHALGCAVRAVGVLLLAAGVLLLISWIT